MLAGWRRKTWLISYSVKSCSVCSTLLKHQRVHMWVRPHESQTSGTSSGCSSQLRQFTREANSKCGRDCVNSDGNFFKLNACCTQSIIQFTKSVVNHRKKKDVLETKLQQLHCLQNSFSIAKVYPLWSLFLWDLAGLERKHYALPWEAQALPFLIL